MSVDPNNGKLPAPILCKFFTRNNGCTFGSKCRNLHNDGYVPKNPICKFFLNSGCTKENCSFSHDELVKKKRAETPCKNFAETGTCAYGEKCSFLH